jgi:ribosomal protein L37AE/L43A
MEQNEEIRKNLVCPMCESLLTHKKVGNTHIYGCSDCPFLGMEFFTTENLKDLTEYLK